MKKGYSIVISSTDSANSRSYFISKRWLKIFFSVCAVVLIILGYTFINYSRVYYGAIESAILKRRNAEIEREFAKLQEIKDNLERTEMTNRKIKNMLGIEKAPAEVEPVIDDVPPDHSEEIDISVYDEENIPSLLPTRGRISRKFSVGHNGADIAAPRFSPVVTAASGTVEDAGWDSVFGNYVIVKHNANYSTFYGHLNSIGVTKNEKVTSGKVVGTVGSTGKSTSPHLHYEVRFQQESVDPVGYLPFLMNFKE